MSERIYEASPIKRRRATRAEMEARYEALAEIVDEFHPVTVRQVFYQATVRGLIEKTENGYGKVQTALAHMRRIGTIPYDRIADNTRWQRKPRTFADPAEALRDTARFYRKDLWANADHYVEIWLEKDALAGVIYDVTDDYDVPLMVSRGYSSLSFLHSAAEMINAIGRPTFIYHLGDFDPSGQDAARKIEEDLQRFAHQVDIQFESLAVSPEQIEYWSLPTRPTKKTDSRSKSFGEVSAELDAIDPVRLRRLVRYAIEQHLPAGEFAVLKAAERSEREVIQSWADALAAA